MNEYEVIDSQNEECRTIKAKSLSDARDIIEAQIDADGSYYYEDNWREVRNMRTGKSLSIREPK